MRPICSRCHYEMVRVARGSIWRWWPWGRKYLCPACGRVRRQLFVLTEGAD